MILVMVNMTLIIPKKEEKNPTNPKSIKLLPLCPGSSCWLREIPWRVYLLWITDPLCTCPTEAMWADICQIIWDQSWDVMAISEAHLPLLKHSWCDSLLQCAGPGELSLDGNIKCFTKLRKAIYDLAHQVEKLACLDTGEDHHQAL